MMLEKLAQKLHWLRRKSPSVPSAAQAGRPQAQLPLWSMHGLCGRASWPVSLLNSWALPWSCQARDPEDHSGGCDILSALGSLDHCHACPFSSQELSSSLSLALLQEERTRPARSGWRWGCRSILEPGTLQRPGEACDPENQQPLLDSVYFHLTSTACPSWEELPSWGRVHSQLHSHLPQPFLHGYRFLVIFSETHTHTHACTHKTSL